MDKVLTLPEVASRLQVNDRTAWNLVRSGQIKGVKVGRLWRVTEQELAKFLGLESSTPSAAPTEQRS